MSSADEDIGCFFIAGFLILGAAVISGGATSSCCREQWQKKLIEKGHAEYNSQNGNWQWKPLRADDSLPSVSEQPLPGVQEP
jgi:hypothetical protein